MSRSFLPVFAAITTVLAVPDATIAQDTVAPSEDAAERIIRQVIERTLEAAAEEIRGDTWGDPAEPWDDPDATDGYEAWPGDATLETRRQLDRLYAQHDRKLAKLEAQLDRKLRKAEREYARETRREHRPRKIEKTPRQIRRESRSGLRQIRGQGRRGKPPVRRQARPTPKPAIHRLTARRKSPPHPDLLPRGEKGKKCGLDGRATLGRKALALRARGFG